MKHNSKRIDAAVTARRNALRAAARAPDVKAAALHLANGHGDRPKPAAGQIFISYSRQDAAVAHALADDLGKAGFPVWWDRELYAGEDFHDAILDALEAASAVIVIWSNAAATSPWVRDEARRADRLKKLITVHVPDFDVARVPLGFGDRHCDNVEDRDRMVRALGRHGITATR